MTVALECQHMTPQFVGRDNVVPTPDSLVSSDGQVRSLDHQLDTFRPPPRSNWAYLWGRTGIVPDPTVPPTAVPVENAVKPRWHPTVLRAYGFGPGA